MLQATSRFLPHLAAIVALATGTIASCADPLAGQGDTRPSAPMGATIPLRPSVGEAGRGPSPATSPASTLDPTLRSLWSPKHPADVGLFTSDRAIGDLWATSRRRGMILMLGEPSAALWGSDHDSHAIWITCSFDVGLSMTSMDLDYRGRRITVAKWGQEFDLTTDWALSTFRTAGCAPTAVRSLESSPSGFTAVIELSAVGLQLSLDAPVQGSLPRLEGDLTIRGSWLDGHRLLSVEAEERLGTTSTGLVSIRRKGSAFLDARDSDLAPSNPGNNPSPFDAATPARLVEAAPPRPGPASDRPAGQPASAVAAAVRGVASVRKTWDTADFGGIGGDSYSVPIEVDWSKGFALTLTHRGTAMRMSREGQTFDLRPYANTGATATVKSMKVSGNSFEVVVDLSGETRNSSVVFSGGYRNGFSGDVTVVGAKREVGWVVDVRERHAISGVGNAEWNGGITLKER